MARPPRFPTHPTNRTPTPPNTTASRLRVGLSGPARSQSSSCPPPPPPPLCSHPPAPTRCRPLPWDPAPEAAMAIPLWRAPAPSSSGVTAPPPAAGSRGGAVPAPSPPPARHLLPPPEPLLLLLHLASKAAEGLGGAASSVPGDRPTSGTPGTSSLHPGCGAGCPSLQSRDGWVRGKRGGR